MIQLYNTLTRQKEDFTPIEEGKVKIYSCGPTVYSIQHIGNMRAALCWDFLRRTFKFLGYEVISVSNITDVGHLTSDEDEGEDKMLKAAKLEKKDPTEIAKFYEKIYTEDLEKLNVLPATYQPRATETIPEQLEIIQKLEKKGYTYKTEDGIYFDVSKFKKYGQLSGQSLEEKKVGARVEEDTQKKNPQDFALWKFLTKENANHAMKWDSPWGEGFPGWHIECSAMSNKFLGTKFDIHTGGIEHIPVHHENEIAQNVCSGAVTQINFWLHNAHLVVNNEKMSKSVGNVYNLNDLIEKKYSPLSLREVMLRTHYRKQLNFTFESLDAGEINLEKINTFYTKIKELKTTSTTENKEVKMLFKEKLKQFTDALKDDLNTPLALSSVYEFIREINKIEKISSADKKLINQFMEETDKVLGLLQEAEEIPMEVFELAQQRKKARDKKNFEEADKIRDEIQELGYVVNDSKDTKEGFILHEIKDA